MHVREELETRKKQYPRTGEEEEPKNWSKKEEDGESNGWVKT